MIPAGWTEKSLGEITDIISGTTPDTTKKEFWGKGNFWITPAELTENQIYVTSTQRELTDLAIKTCSLRPMPRGTVIFSSRAPIGKMAISDVDVLYCNQGFKNFVCHEDLYNKFLFYFLVYNKEYLISLGKGTTFKEVSKAIISQVKICYPSILEQQRIVEKLDTLFADIEKEKQIAQQNLQNAKELFEGELQKLFTENTDGLVEKDFERCIKPVTYTNKIQRKNFLGSGKFPIVSQEDTLINGYWNEDVDVFKIDQPVVIFGDHTKKIKYIDFDFVLGADGVKILVPIAEIIPKYFYYCLQSIKIRDLGYARHYRLLKEKTIKYPDLQAQKEIIEKLDALQEQTQELEKIYTQQIADLDELKQAILKKAFNGELL